jgi:hypothetical protein
LILASSRTPIARWIYRRPQYDVTCKSKKNL